MFETFLLMAEQHLRWAAGVRGWPPQTFWQLTPREVRLAWHGWCESLGITPDQALTRTDFTTLLTLFPDNPHG